LVKTGVDNSNGRKETIKVIVKRKHDPVGLQTKLESLKAVLAALKDSGLKSAFGLLAELYGNVETDKKLFVSSELIVGFEMQKRVLIKQPFSEGLVQQLLGSLVGLLQAFGARGLLYSDLRPERMIITVGTDEEFLFKIVDNSNSLCAKDSVPFDKYKLFYPKVAIAD
jgi:hypothetical protein